MTKFGPKVTVRQKTNQCKLFDFQKFFQVFIGEFGHMSEKKAKKRAKEVKNRQI
jgi:hypothetical protein